MLAASLAKHAAGSLTQYAASSTATIDNYVSPERLQVPSLYVHGLRMCRWLQKERARHAAAT